MNQGDDETNSPCLMVNFYKIRMEYAVLLKFITSSDTALMVALGDAIDPQIHLRVMACYYYLKENPPDGVTELIPSYCNIMVVYDPLETSASHLQSQLRERVEAADGHRDEIPFPKVVKIPVCYGGSYGPDLPQVARYCDLTPKEVIERHCAVEYPIYMIGFSPGFPFLGGLDPRLHTPRLATPRTRVPAGSVGIADAQTGIYPVESPGGWQLIGRTPLQLFRPKHFVPFRYRVGDRLRFVPIEPGEYLQIQAKEAS